MKSYITRRSSPVGPDLPRHRLFYQFCRANMHFFPWGRALILKDRLLFVAEAGLELCKSFCLPASRVLGSQGGTSVANKFFLFFLPFHCTIRSLVAQASL